MVQTHVGVGLLAEPLEHQELLEIEVSPRGHVAGQPAGLAAERGPGRGVGAGSPLAGGQLVRPGAKIVVPLINIQRPRSEAKPKPGAPDINFTTVALTETS